MRLRFTPTRATCNPSDDGKTADARKEPVKHELKCWPDFFEAIRLGRKTFEVRRDDGPSDVESSAVADGVRTGVCADGRHVGCEGTVIVDCGCVCHQRPFGSAPEADPSVDAESTSSFPVAGGTGLGDSFSAHTYKETPSPEKVKGAVHDASATVPASTLAAALHANVDLRAENRKLRHALVDIAQGCPSPQNKALAALTSDDGTRAGA